MSDKIKEFLAVLDMPESKQAEWLCKAELIEPGAHACIIDSRTEEEKHAWIQAIFADLAFRLRDEVLSSENGTIKWVAGMFDVYMKMTGSKLLNWKWGYVKAEPIHWIIAALIARQERK